MKLQIEPDYASVSIAAAKHVARLIRGKARATIMVATGNSPEGTYSHLAGMAKSGEIDLSAVRLFQLDAYLGEDQSGDPPSFQGWLRRALIDPAGIKPEQLTRLRGDAADIDRAAAEYERAIEAAGGLDLAILGLGINGHVGFNEPPARSDSRTRAVTLSSETVAANAGYWGGDVQVPAHGVTAGIGTILEARELVMLVTGANKSEVLRLALEGAVSADVPASLLRSHPAFRVIADEAAASRLSSRG